MIAGEGGQQFHSKLYFPSCHSSGRFIQKKELGRLRKEHSDFQPLFLSVGEKTRRPLHPVSKSDHFEDFVYSILLSGTQPGKEGLPDPLIGMEGKFQIFKDRMILKDSRLLEFPAY